MKVLQIYRGTYVSIAYLQKNSCMYCRFTEEIMKALQIYRGIHESIEYLKRNS